jgi:pilus assembly protein CpaB
MFSLRGRLPRLGRAPRLVLAALCLLLALQSALAARTDPPAGDRGAPVVVAARDLTAGHILTRRDVRVAHWPHELRPTSARADPAQVVGRRLTAAVSTREPITGVRLLGHDLAAGVPAGLVAAPVLLDDPHVVDLVHAGDHVDLLASPRPDGFTESTAYRTAKVTTVASGVVVLAVFRPSDSSGAEIVLAVDRTVAVTVTRDRTTHLFTVVDVPP